MNNENEYKMYKKGVGIGAAIGALSVLLVCMIIIGIIFSRKWELAVANSGPNLSIGNDTTVKINKLVSLIDRYYLYEYDTEEMKNRIYKAVMNSLDDPYTVYYTPAEYEELTMSNEGVFYGIGVSITEDKEKGGILVIQPFENSPAEEVGILANDRIIGSEDVSFVGMDIDTAITYIRGAAGTKVKLTIERAGNTFEVEVERRKVDVVTVASEMLEGQIGYIAISSFDGVTVGQFKKAFDDLNDQGMVGLIIDIRSNPGGMLDVVTAMLDKILPEGIIVSTASKNGPRKYIYSDDKCDLDVPCAVLVNGRSASASEIFAGAMQDHKSAAIIGTQSFGKGIVQSIIPLSDGSAIKITVENYYTPNGNSIHKLGITPDIVVELDADKYLEGIDTQLETAIKYIKDKVK